MTARFQTLRRSTRAHAQGTARIPELRRRAGPARPRRLRRSARRRAPVRIRAPLGGATALADRLHRDRPEPPSSSPAGGGARRGRALHAPSCCPTGRYQIWSRSCPLAQTSAEAWIEAQSRRRGELWATIRGCIRRKAMEAPGAGGGEGRRPAGSRSTTTPSTAIWRDRPAPPPQHVRDASGPPDLAGEIDRRQARPDRRGALRKERVEALVVSDPAQPRLDVQPARRRRRPHAPRARLRHHSCARGGRCSFSIRPRCRTKRGTCSAPAADLMADPDALMRRDRPSSRAVAGKIRIDQRDRARRRW